MRGVALNPEGSTLAAIAIDGLLRVWDLTREDRNAWKGFSGESVEFDARGNRLLCMDDQGQPRLLDIMTLQALYMDKLQMPADRAAFSRDGTMVVAAGQAGISLLRVADGALVASFATRGGSGIMNLLLSPDGTRAAAVTQRSVHVFSLPDLQPVESIKHGAPTPTGAARWTHSAIQVAGSDGLMHEGGGGSAGPVLVVGGFGEHRLAAHPERLAYWQNNRRVLDFPVDAGLRLVSVDRDGLLAVTLPGRGPVRVFNSRTGEEVANLGPETSGAKDVGVGGTVVSVLLASGGVRWWDLSSGRAFELKWPRGMALSGGGTWLGVLTPKGAVKVLDPATGKDAVLPPRIVEDVAVRLLSFVNRRPDLLVLDDDGVLAHYDLGASLRDNEPAQGRDVVTINVEVDRIWGITGGQTCALRLPEGDSCTIVMVDVHACEVVHETTGL
ncbi:MAG: WD40 repeat domain-containing protein, partial [Myxococcota bacterium]|nr:WD40 repeat domain-containing protein [Myxococcota bacterium]